MKTFLLNIICLYLLLGYSQKVSAQQGNDEYFENLKSLKKYSGMKLYVRYAECGEWRGHEEKLELIDSSKKLFITYKVYRYDCDSLDYYYYNDNPPILLSKSKFLDRQDLADISLYIQQLCQAKVDEDLGFHAAEVYSVINSDSTLLIRYSGFDSAINMSYKKLVDALFK